MRAEKRIVNAKKELVKLKEVAAKLHGSAGGKLSKETLEASIPDVQVVGEVPMAVDSDTNTTATRKGRLQIDNRWMNQRKIKAIKSKIKKHNKKKARRGKSAGLSSRKAKRSIRK